MTLQRPDRVHVAAGDQYHGQGSGSPHRVGVTASAEARAANATRAGPHRDEAANRRKGKREHDHPDKSPDAWRAEDDFDRMRQGHRCKWFHATWRFPSSAASARKNTTMRKMS